MTPEIGDKFIIDWEGIKKTYPHIQVCEFPDLEFEVHDFSKSKLSVYYLDRRVSKKCQCQYCCTTIEITTNTIPNRYSIGVNDIIITKKRLAIERIRKLNELGIN